MTHRGPFQPLRFCDSVIQHLHQMVPCPPSGFMETRSKRSKNFHTHLTKKCIHMPDTQKAL